MYNNLKAEVFRQLSQGKDKALTGSILKKRLGLRDTRPIRLAMIALIEDGIPIVFSDKGYYIANTREECDKALDVLRNSYGVKLYRHYIFLKRARDKHFGSDQLVAGQLNMML
jgi:hypothetical protein